ncbi:MAG: D-TA family PLP-dependent enzyme [Gemmatales bacterium]|nr:D-TA family PLP-dependent enzyme [Gemmatales bacterium]MDW8388126.1 D-TA family PLP-dependent enzyme [Gemmatales bacterium]
MTASRYQIHDASAIPSPSLLFYPELIRANLARMIEIAGGSDRLRPHGKTHKTREIFQMALQMGVRKHKVATVAEAELAAQSGVPDVFLAYPLVGPNCERFARLVRSSPQTQILACVDDVEATAQLEAALRGGPPVEAVVDLDVGQHRTGVSELAKAVALYERIARSPVLRCGGLHAYDGHNNAPEPEKRRQVVAEITERVQELLNLLHRKGLPVPRIVAGGTPSFPFWAKVDLPNLECSPGTCVLHDHGYQSKFSDVGFTIAAALLGRVVSKPTSDRVTLDLGTKAVGFDPPPANRIALWDIPEHRVVGHYEEHLILESPHAEQFGIGQEVYGSPTHICTTVALHREAVVVERGRVVDRWPILARDRRLTI